VARKYLIETFGCQMNVHDSERMAGLLEQAGFESTDEAADADVVVINTCSVRERAEEKLYTRLGELRQLAAEQGHAPIVAVAGCVAQQEGAAILKRMPGIPSELHFFVFQPSALELHGVPNPRQIFDNLKQRIIAVKRQRGVIKMDVG